MQDWDRIRELFPAVNRCTYLNTAGGGPISRYAAEEVKRYYDEEFEYGDILWNDWLDRAEEVRGELARQINAHPDEIAFLSNCSSALNLVARFFDPSGQVLTMSDDFPSVTLPWLLNDYPVSFISEAANGGSFAESIQDTKTLESKYLATSFVQYTNGRRHDLAELGWFCRQNELVLIVDATQGFGAFPIDVKTQRIDILTFSGYKWANAGYGIAPLFVKRELLSSSILPACGWRSARVPYDLINDRLDLSQKAVALELGHPPFPGIFALRGALRLIAEIGIENIQTRVLQLTDYLRSKLREADVEILSSPPAQHRSGITLINVDHPKRVAEQLSKKKVFVSARGEGLRLSVHYYNNEGDIDRLMSALHDCRKDL